MRVILFSRPDLFEGEADMIIAMMERGLETLHLRKPDAADERIEQLLRAIPPRLRNRIVLHSAFPLAERYGLRGIHLNSRHPLVKYLEGAQDGDDTKDVCAQVADLAEMARQPLVAERMVEFLKRSNQLLTRVIAR